MIARLAMGLALLFLLPSGRALAERPPVPVTVPSEIGGYDYDRGRDALIAGEAVIALAAFDRSCAMGNMKSCYNAGLLNEDLFKTDADKTRRTTALASFDRACEGGFQRGCVAAAGYYRSALSGVQDLPRALVLLRRACEAWEADGCGDLAEMLHQGEGTAKDFEAARRFFILGCERGGRALNCFNAGLMALNGTGGPPNRLAGFDYYHRACRLGSAKACSNLALEYVQNDWNPEDFAIGKGLFKMACDKGEMIACKNLGYLAERADPGAAGKKQAARLYRQACDGGEGEGCRSLGILAGDGIRAAGRKRDALGLYVRGCNLGSGRSCYNAGLMYLIGYRAPTQLHTGLGWFAAGCKIGDASSCGGAALAALWLGERDAAGGADKAARWVLYGRNLDPASPLLDSVSDYLAKRTAEPPTLQPDRG